MELDYGFLEREGFTREGVKLVKAHCEIYARTSPEGQYFQFEIPVSRLEMARESPLALYRYLLDRNGAMPGPGYFAVRDGIIWYRLVLPREVQEHPLLTEKLLVKMVETVERLGPKILNLERQ